MTRLVALLLTLIALVPGHARAEPRHPRIAVVSIHIAEMPTIARAAAARTASAATIDFYGLGGGLLPGIEKADLGRYDLVLLDAAGPRLLNYAQQIETAKGRTKVLVVGAGTPIAGNIDPAAHPDVARYWDNATEDNFSGLFAYLARLAGADVAVPPPVIYPSLALWHPDAPQPFASVATYLAWEAPRLADAGTRPHVGILFYRNLVLARNAAVIEALIREVERQGGLPVPIWREGGGDLASGLLGAEKLDALILCGSRINYADARAGVAEASRLGVPPLECATDYQHSPAEWQRSPGGFAPDQTGELALSELEGIVEPITVGARAVSADGTAAYAALPDQVRWRVARAMAWARLHRLPNADKRIVVTYHNEEPGTADAGSDPDSYLDAQGSLAALLQRLHREGYDTGLGPPPDAAMLARLMAGQTNTRPGDAAALRQRVADGAITIDADVYRGWYATLPLAVRQAVEKQWGPPPGKLMTTMIDGRAVIVLPAFRLGKITIAAHPIWGQQDRSALATLGALPPHHQYLAFYLWMQHQANADAFLPLFTQLSLMPGKQEGPAADDAVGLLIGAVPHIAPLPLQANGGVANKRRTNAVTIGFMPEIVRAGLSPDLATIERLLGASPVDEVAVRAAATRADLARALGLTPATAAWGDLEPALRRYLAEATAAPMPNGGHMLGRVPDAPTTAKLVQAMLATNGGAAPDLAMVGAALAGSDAALPADTTRLARDYAVRLAEAPREIDAIVAALAGRYVEPGPMQDAIRNPDALPAGRNPYSLDVRGVPTRAAWATGVRLADQLLAQHRARHGSLPRKVAFILWSGETAQNGGTSEAQILHLLGTRPVWNARGQVVDVTLVPRSELGRPRVDVLVTTSGTYRDHFGEKLALIAKAVRLAATAEEADNPVRAETRARADMLVRAGVDPTIAEKRAMRRIFSTAPGAYSPDTQFAAKHGWSPERLNQLYAARLGHAYGDGSDGEADATAFSANLDRVDAAVFSRTSSAYGVLDTDQPAAYLGGLIGAVRGKTGRSIDAYIANGQASGDPHIESLDRFYARERDSRYLNPAWIKAMMASGYDGARHIADLADSMRLWDVTKPDLISARDRQAIRDVYVHDRYGLGLAAWFARTNPAARAKLVEQLDTVGAPMSGDRPSTADAPGGGAKPNAVLGPGRAAQARASGAPTSARPIVSGFELQRVVNRRLDDPTLPIRMSLWLLGLGFAFLFGLGAMRRAHW